MICQKKLYKILIIVFLSIPAISYAGNITSSNKVWGDKIGWVNFGPDNGNVTVTDSAITGYAWSTNYGWINLNPSNGGVLNNGGGVLSGRAWGSNIGWIDFTGVTISPTTGRFTGNTVASSLAGTLNFSCDNCSVITTWRKSVDSGSGGGTTGSQNQTSNVLDTITSLPGYIYDNLIPDFLKPSKEAEQGLSITDIVKKSAPFVMSGKWTVFPFQNTNRFVLAPLPKEIQNLAVKFPNLNKILTDVGVTKITDLDKLRTSNISLSSLSDMKKIPSEIVFAGNGMINLASTIQISDNGKVEQKIETITNKPIKLSVKPLAKSDSVTGYLAFVSRSRNVTAEIPMDSQLAGAIMAISPVISDGVSLDKIEKKLIVSTFEYEDKDKDGVYTAEINAPQVEGEYEVITLIKYSDPDLGTKEMRLITVVDPEGYVYEKMGALEVRIPSAKVSVFKISKVDNMETAELWNAKEYNQDNPQITDKTGKYSFLVPEGEYYITAEANGYKLYKGDTFGVREGKGVHFNIELIRANSLLWKLVDWKVIIILILGIALAVNFWNEKRLIKTLEESNKLKSQNNY